MDSSYPKYHHIYSSVNFGVLSTYHLQEMDQHTRNPLLSSGTVMDQEVMPSGVAVFRMCVTSICRFIFRITIYSNFKK